MADQYLLHSDGRPCKGCQSCLDGDPQVVTPLTIPNYTNHAGVTADRHVIPARVYWGTSTWHPDEKWLLDVYDLDRDRQVRTYPLEALLAGGERSEVLALPPEPEVGRLVEMVGADDDSPLRLWIRDPLVARDADYLAVHDRGRLRLTWLALLDTAGPSGVRLLPADPTDGEGEPT